MVSVTEFTHNGACDPRQTVEHQSRQATLPQRASTITVLPKALWDEGDTAVASSNADVWLHPWTFSFHGHGVPTGL